ncbi:FtsX-like permease family protein [Chloroflexi bacterium TSY]|nr:FtsX-like permease family protein [Chloroflexi bacterium TSY]
MTLFVQRWARFWRIAPIYFLSVAQREWQLGLLALAGLAPGVAALTAWTNLALFFEELSEGVTTADSKMQWSIPPGWLIPLSPYHEGWISIGGFFIGVGMVTLLIGCLAMTNLYLASLERRKPELALLRDLGLRRSEVTLLLSVEAIMMGLFGNGVGFVLGLVISWASWPAMSQFFLLDANTHWFNPQSLVVSGGTGLFAAVLFLGLAAMIIEIPSISNGPTIREESKDTHSLIKSSLYGTLFAFILTFVAALSTVHLRVAIQLGLITFVLAALLTGSAWMLTTLYQRLPTRHDAPLWTLAIEGLGRHPNHTAGMVLALTSGAYGVGLVSLSWLSSPDTVGFPIWVASLILATGAVLVLAVAALSAWEHVAGAFDI